MSVPLQSGQPIDFSFDVPPGIVEFDTGVPPYFDSSMPKLLTAPVAGKYLVVGQMNFTTDQQTAAAIIMDIRKGIITVGSASQPSVTGAIGINLEVSAIIDLAAGESVSLRVTVIGFPSIVQAFTSFSPIFSIARVAS